MRPVSERFWRTRYRRSIQTRHISRERIKLSRTPAFGRSEGIISLFEILIC